MSTHSVSHRPRWTWRERLPYGALLVAFVFTTPELGPETRPAPSGALVAVLVAALLLPAVIAFAASWKWPRAAAGIGVVAGLSIATIIGLDMGGVLIGPAPVGMLVLDGIIVLIGVSMSWLAWAFLRRGARLSDAH